MRSKRQGGSSIRRILGSALIAVVAFGCLRAMILAGNVRDTPDPVTLGAVTWLGDIRNAADVRGNGSWMKRFLKALAGVDSRKKAMLWPTGITIDHQGRLIVADARERVVHIFDSVGRRYKVLRRPGSDPFISPISVATDAAGKIYVSDSGRSRIFVFSEKGQFLTHLGAIDRTESIFKRATGIAIDTSHRRLYVVDTLDNRVVVMSLDGRVISRFGQRGVGPGDFNYPTFIAVAPDGSLWVTDSLNFRVEHFSADGKFLSAFGRAGTIPGNFARAKGISVDAQGRVYVVEGFNDRVQVYDPQGRLLFIFGSSGAGAGQFFLPTGIALDHQNRIYVADSYNRRVETFSLNDSAIGEGR
jgi:DNA-binding beta-propeller fold protein YncE